MTCETWHLTYDTWHMPCDTWHVTLGWGWTFSKHFSSLALPVWDRQCFKDIFTKGDSVTDLISDGDVCRTASASRGLLNIKYICTKFRYSLLLPCGLNGDLQLSNCIIYKGHMTSNLDNIVNILIQNNLQYGTDVIFFTWFFMSFIDVYG